MCSEIGRKIFLRGLGEVGTSDKELGRGVQGVVVIVADIRQGRSNRKDRLAVRQTEGQNDSRAESRYRGNHAGGSNRKTEEEERHADMAVVPSGNTFLPPLFSNVCMFACESDLPEYNLIQHETTTLSGNERKE